MTAHQLKLNPSKTELLIIPGDPSPAQDIAIFLNNSMISPSATARNLGVTMDNQLSFSSHVTNVTRSCRFLLYNIRRIRPFLSTQATQVLVQSLVISRLDYCNSLLAGLHLNAIRPLQMIQNAAARLVFNLPKFSHTTPLLRSLHWLPVAARIRFKTLMLAYKAKNGPAPSYLKALVTPRTAPRSLRSTSTARLAPPSLREKGEVHSTTSVPEQSLDVYLPFTLRDGGTNRAVLVDPRERGAVRGVIRALSASSFRGVACAAGLLTLTSTGYWAYRRLKRRSGLPAADPQPAQENVGVHPRAEPPVRVREVDAHVSGSGQQNGRGPCSVWAHDTVIRFLREPSNWESFEAELLRGRNMLTVLLEDLFYQDLELYGDPAALASAVLSIVKQHEQEMMKTIQRNNWVPRRGDQGPKTIDQVHKDAELEEQREMIKVQQLLLAKKQPRQGRRGEMNQPQDEGRNTVLSSTKKQPMDTSSLSKLRALDINNLHLAPGGKGTWASIKGSSSGTGAKTSTEQAAGFSAMCTPNPFSALQLPEPSSMSSSSSLDSKPSLPQDQELDRKVSKLTLSEEEVEKKSTTIMEEYLHINDLKETVQCVKELNSASVLFVFVRNAVELAFNRCTVSREHTGLLLHKLISSRVLPPEQYFRGLREILEVADDMAIDIPHIWQYLAEIITPMLHDGGIPMGLLFREVTKPLLSIGKAAVLLVHILNRLSHDKAGVLWIDAGLNWKDFLPEDEDVNKFMTEQRGTVA
ncbi:hypothetical protein QTP86_006328 [Hemibagrus guttatus]|nr:hypothetical protein QTP86_006328 [Hemibagrus guttatus]